MPMNWRPWVYTLILFLNVCIVALRVHRGQVDLVTLGYGIIIGMLIVMTTSAFKRKHPTT
jgi:hypothetical protein